jgi:hypothetical protein
MNCWRQCFLCSPGWDCVRESSLWFIGEQNYPNREGVTSCRQTPSLSKRGPHFSVTCKLRTGSLACPRCIRGFGAQLLQLGNEVWLWHPGAWPCFSSLHEEKQQNGGDSVWYSCCSMAGRTPGGGGYAGVTVKFFIGSIWGWILSQNIGVSSPFFIFLSLTVFGMFFVFRVGFQVFVLLQSLSQCWSIIETVHVPCSALASQVTTQ